MIFSSAATEVRHFEKKCLHCKHVERLAEEDVANTPTSTCVRCQGSTVLFARLPCPCCHKPVIHPSSIRCPSCNSRVHVSLHQATG